MLDLSMSLFHGSDKQNLSMLLPNQISSHTNDSKPRVYASPDISYAACFTIGPDVLMDLGRFGNEPWTLKLKRNDARVVLNKSCSIYMLSPMNFEKIEGISTDEYESFFPVHTLKEFKFGSVSQCLRYFKVQLQILLT